MADGDITARFRVDYAGFTLDVDLTLPGRGVTALFGPSGSGKTTLLRCVAGLTRSPVARLVVGGELWQDSELGVFLPTHRRPLGMVFQQPSLFPHFSVRQNLEYGRRRARGRRAPAQGDVLELLQIGTLLERRPASLSGGEQQRVAIARALLAGPELLLMDEPLASLDVRRKLEILPFLERLHDELSIPIVYVSHSPDEVARLADHLVVLERGLVVADGPLVETLTRLDLALAHADDAAVVIDGEVGAHDTRYQLTRIDFGASRLWVGHLERAVGSRVRVRVHARDVSVTRVAPEATSILNVLPVELVALDDDGPERVNLRLGVGDGDAVLLARITRRSKDALALTPGMRLFAQVKGVALR